MRKIMLFTLALITLTCCNAVEASKTPEKLLPVKGLAIAAPKPETVDRFIRFLEEEAMALNTLVLRVDWNYAYETHPELRDSNALSKQDVKKLVVTCQELGIRLIPQVNLLGHQSWASELGNLLEVYPQFDETPHIEIPENYQWPNEDGLYCKSYCTRHPEVHDVVFEVVDEIVEVFEADAFHAGMDEVFYIGHDSCSRCAGMDKARLFADEVRRLRNHLKQNNTGLWIWGDRLLDGKTTGLGMWEASMNNTHRAVDMIPGDVTVCDWHYEKPVATHIYFAMKGLDVITCSWNKTDVSLQQLENMVDDRKEQTPEMQQRLRGMMHTIWTSCKNFLDSYEGKTGERKDVQAFKALLQEMENY